MNALELTGRASTHLVKVDTFNTFLQLPVWKAFQEMAQAALKEGIQIHIVSGYRDFQRQLHLWNEKMLGRSKLLDRQGTVVAMNRLNESERVEATLVWLLIPGSSRHHWGTDIDVMDTLAVGKDYQLQLGPKEYLAGGVFHRMYEWLRDNAGRWDFYFPFDEDRGGIAMEPWHISYGPKAQKCYNRFELEMLEEALKGSEIEGKHYLLANISSLFKRYVKNVRQFISI